MNQKSHYRWALAVKIMAIMAIIGLVISAPFVALYGLGLIVFAPLLLFFIFHRRFIKTIKSNTPFERRDYWFYVGSAILSGLGSAFGFFMFWELSHGIDSPQEPYARF